VRVFDVILFLLVVYISKGLVSSLFFHRKLPRRRLKILPFGRKCVNPFRAFTRDEVEHSLHRNRNRPASCKGARMPSQV
jgi:hypothetical protein